MKRPAHRGVDALVDDLGELGLVDAHGHGCAQRLVVEGGGGGVQHDALHRRLPHHLPAVVVVRPLLVAAELQQAAGGVGVHDVDLARLESLGAGVGIDDRLEGDGAQVGKALAPVVGISGDGHVAVGDPVREHERSRADRVRCAVGVVEHRRRGDIARLRLGQVVGERCPRCLHVDGHGERSGH